MVDRIEKDVVLPLQYKSRNTDGDLHRKRKDAKHTEREGHLDTRP